MSGGKKWMTNDRMPRVDIKFVKLPRGDWLMLGIPSN